MNTQIVATITAPAKEWIAALNRISPALKGKKPVPILHCVHIDPVGGVLSGSDYETSATTAVRDAEGEGAAFLVNYAWLVDAIRSTTGRARSAVVEVALSGEKVTVKANGYSFMAEVMPIVDYPSLPIVDPVVTFTAGADLVRATLKRAVTAVSLDDSLPILNAVQVVIREGELELLSTDRYRLARDVIPGATSGDKTLLLSARAIKAIDRFLTGGDVTIGESEGRISITTEQVAYTALGIDGEYPKIGTLFPDAVSATFEVDRFALLESARVAHLMSERNLPLFLRLFDGGAEVTFGYSLFGPSKAPTAPGAFIAGRNDTINTAFAPRFLIDALRTITTEKVRISYTTKRKPWLITPADDESQVLHLLMPVRMPDDHESYSG